MLRALLYEGLTFVCALFAPGHPVGPCHLPANLPIVRAEVLSRPIAALGAAATPQSWVNIALRAVARRPAHFGVLLEMKDSILARIQKNKQIQARHSSPGHFYLLELDDQGARYTAGSRSYCRAAFHHRTSEIEVIHSRDFKKRTTEYLVHYLRSRQVRVYKFLRVTFRLSH